jgi:MarR family transcriptional regulator, organic hydroperoxide resistance regulator
MKMRAEDCIFFQLAKAAQTGSRFWSQKVAALNLTATQAMVLRFLFDRDEVNSSELGSRTELDSATLTGILDRLKAAGIIERRPNPTDRRAIHIHLTEKGRRAAKEIFRLVGVANTEFLGGLNPSEEKELRRLLDKVRQK